VDPADQYCVEEAVVTPTDGAPTALADLGLTRSVSMLISDNGVGSFNWAVNGWNGEGVGDDVRAGDVRLVLRVGDFAPRYTTAIAQGMRISRARDDAGNTTLTITGHPVHLDWVGGDASPACVSGSDCGGPDTMADPISSGYAFSGNTQNLETWGSPYTDILDGMYLATDAQARPTVLGFSAYPTPTWTIPLLGNPHLDVDGNPVRGSFNAWIPAAYFDSVGSDAATAIATGFDIASTENGVQVPLAATLSEQDGGVAIDVPDLGYSMISATITNRAPASSASALPAAPTAVSTASGSAAGALDVHWTAPEPPLTGATVRAFTAANGGTVAGRCTAATTAGGSPVGPLENYCTITGLTPGDTYWVAVTSSNSMGEGPGSDRVEGTARPAMVLPSAPRAVTAAGGNALATVGWAPPGDDGGSPVIGYRAQLYAGRSGGTPVAGCTPIGPARSCTVRGLVNGRTYFAAVTATNGVGDGPESGPRVAVLPRTVPGAPGSVGAGSARSTVRIGWLPPAVTGGSPVTAFLAEVFDRPAGGPVAARCGGGPALRACVTGRLVPGRVYWVSVRAANALGWGPGSAPRVRTVARR